MRLPELFRKRTFIVLTTLSIFLAVILALQIWHDYSPQSSPRADPHPRSGTFKGSTAASDNPTAEASPTDSASGLPLGGAGSDPFAVAGGPDTPVHQVVFRATSDGALGTVIYRTRGGSTKTIASASSSWSTRLRVRGLRPVAQMAVQVSQNATYARCTIFVDGVQSSTFTAHGTNRVVVCTA